MESNIELRKDSKSWNVVEKYVVPLLSKLTDENGNLLFSKEEIHLAAGVLDTNCFQIKSKEKVRKNLFKYENHCLNIVFHIF